MKSTARSPEKSRIRKPTTDARNELPSFSLKQPFRYSQKEALAITAWTGRPKQSIYFLEIAANGYLLGADAAKTKRPHRELVKGFSDERATVEQCIAVLKSHRSRYVAQKAMHIHERLDLLANDLEALVDCYSSFLEELPKRKIGNNVDTNRNSYFDTLLTLLEGHLGKPIRDGYRDQTGPSSEVVHYMATAARPVIGNDAASLDAIRHYVRKRIKKQKLTVANQSVK